MEMDDIQKQMRRFFLTATLLLGVGLSLSRAQTLQASRVLMDTLTYGLNASKEVVAILDTYGPELHDKMNKVVGYTTQTMSSYPPESPLSNMAANALLAIAKRHYGQDKVDFALTNFGGIRTSFPKGNVTLYYVYAAFPFENTLVLVSLKGKEVRTLFEHFAQRRPEALAGIKLVIENNKVKELFINDQPLDDERTYQVATIDFLLHGGDKMSVLAENLGVDYSGITIRDVILEYISAFYEKGEPIPATLDGRVVVINNKDKS